MHAINDSPQDNFTKSPYLASERRAIQERANRKVALYHRPHPELTCPCCEGHDIMGFMQGNSLQVHCMNPDCGLEGVTLGRSQWQALTLDEIAAYSTMNANRRARRELAVS